MVGWIFTFKLLSIQRAGGSQYIRYKIGSIGPIDDQFFQLVTSIWQYAHLPQVYLSANSGARIGIAEEALPLFSAAWNDASDAAHPEKGFNCLYLTHENNLKIQKKGDCVRTVEIKEDGERRAEWFSYFMTIIDSCLAGSLQSINSSLASFFASNYHNCVGMVNSCTIMFACSSRASPSCGLQGCEPMPWTRPNMCVMLARIF